MLDRLVDLMSLSCHIGLQRKNEIKSNWNRKQKKSSQKLGNRDKKLYKIKHQFLQFSQQQTNTKLMLIGKFSKKSKLIKECNWKKFYCKVVFFLEGMIVLIVRYAHNKFYLNKKDQYSGSFLIFQITILPSLKVLQTSYRWKVFVITCVMLL